MKTGLVQDAWKVWGVKPLSKQYGIGFAEIRSGKRRSCPESLNISTQSSHTSSGTIYTWERTSAQRDVSLLLLWRKSDGQEQSGTPRTGTKTSSSRTRIFSPSRSTITTSTTRFVLKSPLRCLLRVQDAITLPTSWFGGGCPIRGWHLFIFARNVWKLMSERIKRMCYKELWNLLIRLSSVAINGSSSRTQILPTRPRRLRGGCGERSGIYQRRGLALGESRPQPPGIQTVGCFGGHGLPKASQQPGQPEEIPRESSGRDLPGDVACRDSRDGRSVSRLASRQRAAILSDIVINKNLKLLLIHYFARKVDVLFHFPSRSQYTWDRIYGKTIYSNGHLGNIFETLKHFIVNHRSMEFV